MPTLVWLILPRASTPFPFHLLPVRVLTEKNGLSILT